MHEGSSEPLSPEDREDILSDLEEMEVFQTLLEPRGVRGLVVDCGECDTAHYFEWELLRANLRHLLDVGSIRVHEPAFDPDPADYVTWDYALGFSEGVLAASEEEDVALHDEELRTDDVGATPSIDLR